MILPIVQTIRRRSSSRPGYSLRSAAFVLLALALAAAPGPCRAAGSLPGYVVLPLIRIGTQAAGIRVKANGHPISLIVDTGASHTVFDRRLYRKITADQDTRPASVLLADYPTKVRLNGVHAEVGQIRDFEAGPIRFGSEPVMVLDLPMMSAAYRDFDRLHGDAPVGGLLGEDILRNYAAIIDWHRRAIYFNTVPAKRVRLGRGLTTNGWTAVPMTRTRGRHFTVPTVIDGRPFQLIVDTGAAFTMLDTARLHSRDIMYDRGVVQMHMIGSRGEGRPVVLKNWTIGTYAIPSFPVVAEALPDTLLNESAPGNGPTLGLLGSEALARNSAIIDINDSTLFLKPVGAR